MVCVPKCLLHLLPSRVRPPFFAFPSPLPSSARLQGIMVGQRQLVLHFLFLRFFRAAFWNYFHLKPSKACGWMKRDRQIWRVRDWWICSIISWVLFFVDHCASGPSSLPLLFFSLYELLMRELYWLRQIGVSLPHNTNNRGYYERREGSIVCTLSMNTRSHSLCVRAPVLSLPVYL